MTGPDEIPGWKTLDVGGKNVLSVDRNTHLEYSTKQCQIGGLAACAIGGRNDESEIVNYFVWALFVEMFPLKRRMWLVDPDR
jgi:hypothetical protein